ncbi:MAG: hypothetical protein H6815_07815 [Phycisphaeraceae bacterium]|nr:hypothetical protein [Phycisphaerales bacterium]MCB9860347.1 hypothetical protein [Phycisphaeraceae bacterium]
MSDPIDPNNPLDTQGPEETPSPRLVSGSRRTSVRLRSESSGEEMPELDLANKSVSEALELAFGVVKLAMIVLIVLFLLSGFQTVRENESGVRVLFGEMQGDRLPPGFQPSYPYPIGELVKVPTSSMTVDLEGDFWPFVSGQNPDRSDVEKLSATAQLQPGQDGSLITGDQAIAHALVSVTYHRDDVVQYAKNIEPRNEEDIVRYSIRRAMVVAAAEMKVDDFIKQQASSEVDSVSSRVQRLAQDQLDKIESGLRIDRLSISQTMVPVGVRDAFTQVLNATSNAAGAAVKAENEASRVLASVAGDAGKLIVREIRNYEDAIEQGNTTAQEEILQRIYALLEGRPVEINGEMIEGRSGGEVSEILAAAEQYRTSQRNRMKAEVELFLAKLEQFKINPGVTVQTAWADAYKAFVDRDTVQITYLPATAGNIELLLNEDPYMTKLQRQLQDQRRNQDAANERDKMQNQRSFQTTEQMLLDS